MLLYLVYDVIYYVTIFRLVVSLLENGVWEMSPLDSEMFLKWDTSHQINLLEGKCASRHLI